MGRRHKKWMGCTRSTHVKKSQIRYHENLWNIEGSKFTTSFSRCMPINCIRFKKYFLKLPVFLVFRAVSHGSRTQTKGRVRDYSYSLVCRWQNYYRRNVNLHTAGAAGQCSSLFQWQPSFYLWKTLYAALNYVSPVQIWSQLPFPALDLSYSTRRHHIRDYCHFITHLIVLWR